MFDAGKMFVKFKSGIKGFPRDAGWRLGLNRKFAKKARGTRILVYHGICISDHLRFNTLFLKRMVFESQLRLYKKYFNIISLDDYYKGRFSIDRFNICLTFDDGFANNYRYVLPLLEHYEVPATFFITAIRDAGYDILWNDVLTVAYRYGPSSFVFRNEEFKIGKQKNYVSSSTGKGLVDILRLTGFEAKAEIIDLLGECRKKTDKDYWLQMTKEEIKSLSQNKWVTIGSHGYWHNDLGKIPIDLVRQELGNSKKFLENLTGKEIKALAFPYGSYAKAGLQAAKDAGYTQLLATDFIFAGDAEDATLRERLTINPFISNINQMHANISGNYR